MAIRGLYVFSHDDTYGKVPAHKLFDRIRIKPLGHSEARSWDEYADRITIDRDGISAIQAEGFKELLEGDKGTGHRTDRVGRQAVPVPMGQDTDGCGVDERREGQQDCGGLRRHRASTATAGGQRVHGRGRSPPAPLRRTGPWPHAAAPPARRPARSRTLPWSPRTTPR
jgi:hypothetical protein